MFHALKGKITQFGDKKLLQAEFIGIEVHYNGGQTEGRFYLFPYLDDNNKTITYFGFESMQQKLVFEKMIKLSGIGPKTAYNIAQISPEQLKKAVEQFDVQFFQSLPGIGPKLAKRLCVELKHTITTDDKKKLTIDDKLLTAITGSMKNMGYDSKQIKKLLPSCTYEFTKANLPQIIKWLIDEMNK